MTQAASGPRPQASFSHVYVHVPFCARRCTYCDFAIAVRPVVPVAEYVAALTAELRLVPPFFRPSTVYLGGGTPSKLGADGVARVTALFGSQAAELTIEANPEDVSAEAARAWARAGVNRVSLGAQSFSDAVLTWMHRTHDAAAIGAAVRTLRAAGIGNISLDLIFALPESVPRDFAADLARMIALEPEHLSLYGLTIEPRTPLARQIARGQSAPPREARYEDEYLLAHERLAAAGFRFYEVSNAARPGRESAHNSAYWQQVPYLGIGPSAHSFDGQERWWNDPAYRSWLDHLAAGRSPVAGRETLSDGERRLESWYLGLRTAAGLTLDRPLPSRLEQSLQRWVAQGWARLNDRGNRAQIVLTPAGWLRLDELVASV